MAKNLLIVESPAKAATIKKYLGKDFDVRASVGHVVDLPPNRLGVDVSHDFDPEYQIIRGKEKVLGELTKAAKGAQQIYLAPDPDREGEAIAWHIAQRLGRPIDEYHRVLFYELTKDAIQKAVAQPESLNGPRYDSQQARRVLDRLVGYQISPLLWDKVRRGLSAGRVQSVALRLVVEREREIRAFIPQEYWSITAELAADEPPRFKARLARLDDHKFEADNEAQTMSALEAVKGGPWRVAKVVQKKRQQRPAPPFITSTLQQDAYRKLGFAPKRTMALAQRLYEGKAIGSETVGLITYMRTDSTRLSAEAVGEARRLIESRHGADYLPAKPNVYKARSGAQEAHEAIRPTAAFRDPDMVAPYLQKDELALYRLIWTRFIACQMAPAEFLQTQAEINSGPGLFRASGQVMTFPGYTAIYTEGQDDTDDGDGPKEGMLPPLKEGQELDLKDLIPKQHFTQPPPRFTEATLVKELEEKGIGRPSTYASILATLQDKTYVEKNQKKHLVPSELGMIVTDLLVESFPRIMEVGFTANLESDLDKVEEGGRNWRELLKEFYDPFARTLAEAKTGMRQVKGQGVATEIACPTCGSPMVIRLGQNGAFLACGSYPQCKTTMDFTRDEKGDIQVEAPAADPGVTCDKCGEAMMVKKGKYGPFLACSGYPQCKNIRPLDAQGNPAEPPSVEGIGEKCPQCGGELVVKATRAGGRFISCSNYPSCRYSRGIPTGVKCPQCGGDLVEKTSRRGKVFYGCDQFPKCDFAIWDKPTDEACPDCGHPFLVQKTLKKGETLRCPAKGCRYSRSLEPAAPGEAKPE